jgi:hypothetical protein
MVLSTKCSLKRENSDGEPWTRSQVTEWYGIVIHNAIAAPGK